MCLYLYIRNEYAQYTHICKQELLFWMWLIAINRLTALVNITFLCAFLLNCLSNDAFFLFILKSTLVKKKLLVKLVKKSLKTSLFCYFLLHSLTY